MQSICDGPSVLPPQLLDIFFLQECLNRSQSVHARFARALQKKQTSVAEWVLLCELHERGQTAPGELADSLGVTRGAVSKIVDKLDEKGWIQTEVKEGDSRFHLLSLTWVGRRSLPFFLRLLSAYFWIASELRTELS